MRTPTQNMPVRRGTKSLPSLKRSIGSSQGCACRLAQDEQGRQYCEPDWEDCPDGVLAVCGDPPTCPCNCGGNVATAIMVQAVLDAYGAASGG
jgi:hypothetical protein